MLAFCAFGACTLDMQCVSAVSHPSQRLTNATTRSEPAVLYRRLASCSYHGGYPEQSISSCLQLCIMHPNQGCSQALVFTDVTADVCIS